MLTAATPKNIIMARLRMRSKVYGSVFVCGVLQLLSDKLEH